jgi:tetratricopeptide (TPR) repeat protein
MSDNQPSPNQLNEIIGHFNKNNLTKAEHLANLILDKYPDNIFCHKILAVIYGKLGMHSKALVSNKKVISVNPDDAEGYNNLGISYKNMNLFPESITAFKKAIELNATYADVYYNLSNVLEIQGCHDESFEANLSAIMHGSKNKEVFISLCKKLIAIGHDDDAIVVLDNARSIHPQDIELDTIYSMCLSRLGKYDEAMKCLDRLLKDAPNNSDVHTNRGISLKAQGKLHEACLAFEKAVSLNRSDATAHYNLALSKKYVLDDPQISQMINLVESKNLDQDDICLLCFALGKAFGDIGDAHQEFSFFKKGNTIRYNQVKYNQSKDIEYFTKIRSSFSQINSHALTAKDIKLDIIPIFIVGMPRSGTTLVEQIISSHDQIDSCGELPYISRFGDDIAIGKTRPTKKTIMNFRKRYFEKIGKITNKSSMIVDKMPFNFIYLGIINSAFPEAKIIHTYRSPEATCWSIYKQNFGTDRLGLGFSYDLDHIKNYYSLYIDLMRFYSTSISHKMFELDYEELVNSQEQETKKLINYLDLEWQEDCLFPEKNQRSVQTASNLQVRKKVYKGSSLIWKKYKPFLGGAFDNLEKYN